MPFLSFLNNFYKMHNLFFKKLLIISDKAQNMLIFGRNDKRDFLLIDILF